MRASANLNCCEMAELACAYAVQALASSEVAAAEAHIASCPDCQRELDSLRPVVDRFVSWPADVLRPTTSLEGRLALRIAEETGKPPLLPPPRRWSEPQWEQVAPGIECKLLATDTQRHRVSMLVRLAPARVIQRTLMPASKSCTCLTVSCGSTSASFFPGDYNYAGPGSGDQRVWSETGCTCVLVTSTRDVLAGQGEASANHAGGSDGIDRSGQNSKT